MPSTPLKPYELIVMTRPASGWSPGHAMIGIGRAGCQGLECCLEVWGFYPDGVMDESTKQNRHLYNRSVVFPITDRQRQFVEAEIERWRDASYFAGVRDCTDFVVAILGAAGMIVRDELWPDDLGDGLERKFGRQWGACRP